MESKYIEDTTGLLYNLSTRRIRPRCSISSLGQLAAGDFSQRQAAQMSDVRVLWAVPLTAAVCKIVIWVLGGTVLAMQLLRLFC
ncbi:unnamed protein product [Rhodiola kirilowii]